MNDISEKKSAKRERRSFVERRKKDRRVKNISLNPIFERRKNEYRRKTDRRKDFIIKEDDK
ncbi:MAG: hypothetical protein SV062_04705 [Thermodesulfobacteriota bacterium]|nr:hypothetical protein [Thermodesulfobacteriota bacterium]